MKTRKAIPHSRFMLVHCRDLLRKLQYSSKRREQHAAIVKSLYDKYTEFVEIVASQGNLTVAQRYIDLLPGENDAVKSLRIDSLQP